jgi:hypothetical protein
MWTTHELIYFLNYLLIIHYEKRGVLQLALQLCFLVAMITCNSLYFYVVNVI